MTYSNIKKITSRTSPTGLSVLLHKVIAMLTPEVSFSPQTSGGFGFGDWGESTDTDNRWRGVGRKRTRSKVRAFPGKQNFIFDNCYQLNNSLNSQWPKISDKVANINICEYFAEEYIMTAVSHFRFYTNSLLWYSCAHCMRVNFCPQHWLLCHLFGFHFHEFEFEFVLKWKSTMAANYQDKR